MSFLAIRVIIGCSILSALLVADLLRHGGKSRRLREYGFLAACVVATMAFCVVADAVTSRISPEYFHWGKELGRSEGAFGYKVVWLALSAGWPAGLAVGAALLAAGALGSEPPAPFLRLFRRLAACAGFVVAIGILGGMLFVTDPFEEREHLPSWSDERKLRYLVVQGMHLGAYLGGGLGTVIGVLGVARERRTRNSGVLDQPVPLGGQ